MPEIVHIRINGLLVEARYSGESTKYPGYSVVIYKGRKYTRKIVDVISDSQVSIETAGETPPVSPEGTTETEPIYVPAQPISANDFEPSDASTSILMPGTLVPPPFVPAQATTTIDVSLRSARCPDSGIESNQVTDEPSEDDTFSVSERFQFIVQLVSMVIDSQALSLIVTGSGGTGKTHIVMSTIEEREIEEGEGYVLIKGYSTARSLYDTLYQSNGKIIIFDDCDSVLDDRTAVNILKGALDTTRHRTVSWYSGQGGSTPSSFEFTGRIIFISNKPIERIPQPILSRSLFVDVTLTSDEMVERIRQIMPKIKPELHLSYEQKEEVLQLIIRYQRRIRDFNIRTFIKLCDIRNGQGGAWKRLATYVLIRQPVS